MENHAPPGEAQLFTEIYGRNVDAVYRLCYVYMKNRADAEDAVQAVFLKLLRSGTSFADRAHERAWLITTAKNCCRDMLKSWWRRQRVDLETLPEPAAPDGGGAEGEMLERLFALPGKYRVALYLFYWEQYSVKEIAAMVGSTESTVRSRLQRGRNQLKLDLGGLTDGKNVEKA